MLMSEKKVKMEEKKKALKVVPLLLVFFLVFGWKKGKFVFVLFWFSCI